MTRALTLKECYAVLGVSPSATLDEIKHAYRTRAFDLHPDLNPTTSASRQFQQLNEAYVTLLRMLSRDKPTASPESGQAKTGRQAYAEQAQKNREEAERKEKERKEHREWERWERAETERKNREQRAHEEKIQWEAERRERLREEIERQEAARLARKKQAQEEKERLAREREALEKEAQERAAREREPVPPRPESHKRTYSRPNQHTTASHESTDHEDEAHRDAMMQDLLNDPFARRVYEDIYSEIQSRKAGSSGAESLINLAISDETKLLGKNIGKSIKEWVRGQIDEKQELHFPATSLHPGAKFRLQIRTGISGELRTVEVTLPPDFTVGKPVRLKGMGKKVGKWQGDLYLTFQIKQ